METFNVTFKDWFLQQKLNKHFEYNPCPGTCNILSEKIEKHTATTGFHETKLNKLAIYPYVFAVY